MLLYIGSEADYEVIKKEGCLKCNIITRTRERNNIALIDLNQSIADICFALLAFKYDASRDVLMLFDEKQLNSKRCSMKIVEMVSANECSYESSSISYVAVSKLSRSALKAVYAFDVKLSLLDTVAAIVAQLETSYIMPTEKLQSIMEAALLFKEVYGYDTLAHAYNNQALSNLPQDLYDSVYKRFKILLNMKGVSV